MFMGERERNGLNLILNLLSMAHKKEKPVRKIVKNGRGSYYINIPKEYMRELDWQERQKLTIEKKGKEIIIKDWKK